MTRAYQLPATDEAIRDYVAGHFWPLGALARACALSEGETLAMIAEQCSPGVIYARDEHGWWSAVSGREGGGEAAPSDTAEYWYTPAATWGLRQATVARREGASLAEAARRNRERFQRDFRHALAMIPEARNAFPECYAGDGSVDPARADEKAVAEWESWIRGGYAVCLRVFTGRTCVEKEALGATLKRHLADPAEYPLARDEALAMCERLAGLMLPFSPWERPTCTPGRTIDRLLDEATLGREFPYGIDQAEHLSRAA